MCNKFTQLAFAAILANGSIVAWGSEYYRGDSSAVQHQLQKVQQIQATPLRHLLPSRELDQ